MESQMQNLKLGDDDPQSSPEPSSLLTRQQPSPYAPPPPSPTNEMATLQPRVKLTHIPERNWGTNMCREWLHDTMVLSYGIADNKAQEVANKFFGIGPTLYLMSQEQWVSLMSGVEDGEFVALEIYDLLLGLERIGEICTNPA